MKSKLLIAFLVAGLGLTFVNAAFAVAPDTFVRQKLDRALKIICDTGRMDALASDTIREKLIRTFEDEFDYEEMTLRILGPRARKVNEKQLNRLVEVFTELLQGVYVERLTSDLAEEASTYRINSIEVGEVETRRDGRYARVQSTASLNWDGEGYTARMYYYLIRSGESWKIYNFEVEGVGLIKNYRRQFASFLANNTINELIDRLRKQVKGDVSIDTVNVVPGSE